MLNTDIDERRLLGASLIVLAVSLGAASGAAAVLAMDHMALAASLCGPTSGHCIRCVAAGGMLAAALGALAGGLSMLGSVGRPQPNASRRDARDRR